MTGLFTKAYMARCLLRIGRGRRVYRYLMNCMGGDYRMWADWLRQVDGMRIGANTSVNPKAELMDQGELTIGSNCSISACNFITHSGGDRIIREAWGYEVDSARPIVIGNNCVIGYAVTIMYGVTIGDNCVIGAGSYISRDVPAGTVIRPAESTRYCDTEGYVERLVKRTKARYRPHVVAVTPVAEENTGLLDAAESDAGAGPIPSGRARTFHLQRCPCLRAHLRRRSSSS